MLYNAILSREFQLTLRLRFVAMAVGEQHCLYYNEGGTGW
jgi:hypothetical protein